MLTELTEQNLPAVLQALDRDKSQWKIDLIVDLAQLKTPLVTLKKISEVQGDFLKQLDEKNKKTLKSYRELYETIIKHLLEIKLEIPREQEANYKNLLKTFYYQDALVCFYSSQMLRGSFVLGQLRELADAQDREIQYLNGLYVFKQSFDNSFNFTPEIFTDALTRLDELTVPGLPTSLYIVKLANAIAIRYSLLNSMNDTMAIVDNKLKEMPNHHLWRAQSALLRIFSLRFCKDAVFTKRFTQELISLYDNIFTQEPLNIVDKLIFAQAFIEIAHVPNYEQALQLITRAITLLEKSVIARPNYSYLHYSLGCAHIFAAEIYNFNSRHFAAAEQCFYSALKIEADPRYQIALAYTKKKNNSLDSYLDLEVVKQQEPLYESQNLIKAFYHCKTTWHTFLAREEWVFSNNQSASFERMLALHLDDKEVKKPAKSIFKRLNFFHEPQTLASPSYWYTDEDINKILQKTLKNGEEAEIMAAVHPLINGRGKAQSRARFQEVIQLALNAKIPSVVPINVTCENVSNFHKRTGYHWISLVVFPNSANPLAPEIVIVDPLGNDIGHDIEIVDVIDKKRMGILGPKWQRYFSDLINQIQTAEKDFQPKIIVKSVVQQAQDVDCGPWTVDNLTNLAKKQPLQVGSMGKGQDLRGEHLRLITSRVISSLTTEMLLPIPRKTQEL